MCDGKNTEGEGHWAALTKDEKTQIKEAKEKMEAPYGTVILDTHTEKNGNFRVEPAGLFRGRGEKLRVKFSRETTESGY